MFLLHRQDQDKVRSSAHQWELQQRVHPFSRQRRRQGTEASVVAAGISQRGQLEFSNLQGTSDDLWGHSKRSEVGIRPLALDPRPLISADFFAGSRNAPYRCSRCNT